MNDCANDPFTDCVGGGNKPHSPWCYWYVGTGECEDCENGRCTMNCSSASLSPTHKPNLASAPAGDGDRYEAGYSQGTIDAGQQHQWMQDKAWQDAVLMLVHYSTLAERTWLVGHEEAARKLTEWWAHARALADTKSADDIAALARPRAAVGEREANLEAALRRAAANFTLTPRNNRDGAVDKHIEAARDEIRLALQAPPAKVEG